MIFGESPAEQGTGAFPIVLPLPDLNTTVNVATSTSGTHIYNSVTHPDVVYIPQGFGDAAHRYWMACTPYPDNPVGTTAREQPNVFASYDGVNWVVPDGGTNPVAIRTEAIAALGTNAYLADPDLVFVSPNLILFYMRFTTALDWQLVRRTSVNGRKWSDPVVTVSGATPPMLSPAVVSEGGNNLTVFYVKGTTGGTPTIQYRTSTDLGVTWSSEQNTTISKCTDNRPDFWHMDVVKSGGKYHALILSKTSSEGFLWYYTSTDKTNWNLESNEPAIPYSGNPAFDGLQHYRSTLVAKEGGLFDVWVCGQPHGATADDTHYWPTLDVSCSATSPGVVTTWDAASAHFCNTDDEVVFGGTTVPSGLTAGTTYYVKRVNNVSFQVASTKGGASINFASTGTAVRCTRNPWRLTLYRNVALPMQPNILTSRRALTTTGPGGGFVIPPANTITGALATWPTANLGFAQKFRIDSPIELRYFSVPAGVQNGNIECGVLRIIGGLTHLIVTPLVTSGVIAMPAVSGSRIRVDLGRFVLTPGEYWLWFWCDNTTATFPAIAIGYGGTFHIAQASLTASGGKAMPVAGTTLDATGGRSVAHALLEGDYGA